VGKSQFGDEKFFTKNFLYYIDFLGWATIIQEGKKAGQCLEVRFNGGEFSPSPIIE